MSADLAKQIAHNTFFQVGSKLIGTMLGVVTIAVMTRHLGTEGFGQYTTIMGYLQIFGIMADFGLSITATQMLSHPHLPTLKIMNNLFSLRIISSIIFFLPAPLLLAFFPYSPEVKMGILINTLSFLCLTIFPIFLSVFQKYLATFRFAISEITNRVILLTLVLASIFYGWGILGIVWAMVAGNAVQMILAYRWSRKYIPFTWEIDWNVWKQILSQSWPVGVSIFFNLLYFKADTLILSVVADPHDVGIYGASYKVLEVLVALPYLFSGLILPILTQNWASGNHAFFRTVFQKSFDAMTLVTLPMVAGGILLAKPIIGVVAGPEFEESAFILQILLVAAGVIYMCNLFSHAIVAIGEQKSVITSYIVTSIFALVTYTYFIPRYTTLAAAILTIASELMISYLVIRIVYKKTNFFPNLHMWLPSILGSLGMCGAILSWQYFISSELGLLNLLVQLGLGISVYFTLLLYQGMMSKKMIVDLIRVKK